MVISARDAIPISIIMTMKETMNMSMSKESELKALKGRYNLILSRGKTIEGEGVLRKIRRKIRKLEKELNV